MVNIKKYATGQFFDSINKKYIKVDTLKKMITKGEKIKITLAKTGKDITKSVIEQFSKKDDVPKTSKDKKQSKGENGKNKKVKKTTFLNTDSLKKWAGKFIDTRVTQVLETIKLPTRKQIKELDSNIKALNKKIDTLEALQKRKPADAKPAQDKKICEQKIV